MRRWCVIAGLTAVLIFTDDLAKGAEGPLELAPIVGCGGTVPAYFLNPGDVAGMFGTTPDAMRTLFATSYAEDLARICRERAALATLLRQRVAAICFAAAAGVDEPYPYVVGKWLVIEVHPDAYARVPFRRKLATAIERGSVGAPVYDCAPRDEQP